MSSLTFNELLSRLAMSRLTYEQMPLVSRLLLEYNQIKCVDKMRYGFDLDKGVLVNLTLEKDDKDDNDPCPYYDFPGWTQ